MPLNGGGTASRVPGTSAAPNQTIKSADYNAEMDDVYNILNTARPIAYGGTGSDTEIGAANSLKVPSFGAAQSLTTDQKHQVLSNIGSAWEIVTGSGDFSSVASVSFTNLSAYRNLRITLFVSPSVNATTINIRTSSNNGSSYDSGSSDYTYQQMLAVDTSSFPGTFTASSLLVSGSGILSGSHATVEVLLTNFNASGTPSRMLSRGYGANGSAVTFVAVVGGQRSSTTARNAFQIFPGSGGTFTGSILVEGARQ